MIEFVTGIRVPISMFLEVDIFRGSMLDGDGKVAVVFVIVVIVRGSGKGVSTLRAVSGVSPSSIVFDTLLILSFTELLLKAFVSPIRERLVRLF